MVAALGKAFPLRILVVEDDDDSREIMAEVLRAMGTDIEISLAKDGHEGLHYLRGRTYDVIVTDIGLPGVSGLEMLELARREGHLPDATLIVVCSAHVSLGPRVIAEGASFIPKPADLDALVDVVQRGIAVKQRTDRAH